MTTPTRGQLVLQLDDLRHDDGMLVYLRAAADTHGLPLGLWLAINSRETNCANILGDYQGGQYHGVGMCQIDIQHDIARQARDDGSWKTPKGMRLLQDFGAALFAANVKAVLAAWDQATVDDDVLKCAASGYNCGVNRAIGGDDAHNDSDYYTTGRDYGADVMARKAVFDRLLAGETT